MSFTLRITPAALEDLARLYEHDVMQAETMEDLLHAQSAHTAVTESIGLLARSPFLYRKATDNAFLRELIVPFGRSGYVVLYEITDASHVDVLAVRHQREDDYH